MNAKLLYDRTASNYDQRQNNSTTKLMRKVEEELIKKFVSGRVLDIGCGTGYHLKKNVVGLDISFPMLKEAKKKGHENLIHAKAERLPFADNSFDSILCLFAVLSVCNYEKVVKEMKRVLKKNGTVFVSVASIWDYYDKKSFWKRLLLKGKHDRKSVHIDDLLLRFSLFRKNKLIKLFEKNGFRLKKFHGMFILQKPYWSSFIDFSFWERSKLRIERYFQIFNRSAYLYMAVFELK